MNNTAMWQTINNILVALFIIAILVLFVGDPDVHDGIVKWMNND